MVFRAILAKWRQEEDASLRRSYEGEFTSERLEHLNRNFYHVYYFPNYPSFYDETRQVDGSQIDEFRFVFVDCDLKDGKYADKQAFISYVQQFPELKPTLIVDSGRGIHAYWEVSDLDAMSYLRLQRRLARFYNTDAAVSQICQLMRFPGYWNHKDKDTPVYCDALEDTGAVYTCEQLDRALAPITAEDEQHCQQHYEKTYNPELALKVTDKLPDKFGKLVKENKEAREIWSGNIADRSKGDYRLGHLMLASGFSRDEALSVLVNSSKALTRAPIHRVNYADGIVSKIWPDAIIGIPDNRLSQSVEEIIRTGSDEDLKGKRFPCQDFFDGTEHGFRLGQVVGLCAGVGVGKTAIGLNLFKGFVERNPSYIHMFVALEQPGREIAARWKKMCGENTALHKMVHVLSNYNADGSYRNLSLAEIQDYLIEFQKETGQKIGCVCIDHIGVLKQESRAGEYQGLRDICSQLKAFAVATNTLTVIQSQTNREKAGIGDLELFKDAAFGTQHFESFMDFLIVAWQPLKRCYNDLACPRVTAYKYAKVRFKSPRDAIVEDQCYRLVFESDTELLRRLTEDEEKSFDFFANQCLVKRKRDRKTDLVEYVSEVKLEKQGA